MPGAVGIELDARDELSVARAVQQAWTRLGGIDMLVNNAGIGMRGRPALHDAPAGFLGGAGRRLPGGGRDQSDRLLPAGHGRHRQPAAARGRDRHRNSGGR
ncbi:MAG TPA: SDR family NAD(P)-dependent oxidoreductase [Actinomycetota bacterium]|nr:SDR family NAD(P)-dependent oxidoreductase [Actinomycetota bacterium]